MNSRTRTIWLLLNFFTTFSIIVAGIALYPVYRKWDITRDKIKVEQFGTDKELEQEIEFLEQLLETRNQYQFELESEPLRLTNVVYLMDAFGRPKRYRQKEKVRVTAIIDGNQQQAVINFDNKNFTVTVGDSVAGGEVVWIDAEEVVIINGDKEMHYQITSLMNPTKNSAENSKRSKN